ncbi:Coenzyme F420 hydrogenase/dehydrogenase, beta subunit C-terminal domain [Nostoc sp. ATCC 53789]|uniref:Coenzyme F420 hydrogenase/dehydrogenase, beta subunit C-terminal domain n=1 Tax=Nostoc sp. ATCC 53789 TaxID=76335 RepID=UPI000DECFBBA|nr:Coenzyme F420 hydrogenase/dehydrogenase, beta subunit C-terminal domain [Nostoc sp. ATCC 53789]QHG15280.1 coenzyme F420 hydrogenase [Nostoc sp. ATCC 53789]RCJ16585.1 coenzyme F420 hydrogenase [Nostoc sp. ATCC 53789]
MYDHKAHLEVKKLFKTVIEGGYCIGCGACASVSNSPIKMKLDEYGCFSIDLNSDDSLSTTYNSLLAVCPFSDQSLNEDQINQEIFSKDCKYQDKIGYYLATYAGYVVDSNFRERGSSGGLVTWLATQLLNENLVDGIIHIHQHHPTEEDSRLFKYDLSLTEEDIRNGAKSRYYPVEMSEVIQLIRDRPGRYAIVGVPCFIKAIRLLMRQDTVIAERIKFCIGLVCGHLKSTAFAKAFAWQSGIEPNNIISIDFRKKLPNAPANKYGVEVTGIKDGKTITLTSPVKDFYVSDWGLGFFKYKACDYCDDVVAETADISIGDAWLPQYTQDSQGTNVVVVRNPVLYHLLEQARISGRLRLEVLDPEEVVKSQIAGFRHRHDGLAYRLFLTDNKGEWRPPKRVKPKANHLDKADQKRFRLRTLIAEQSHIAFKNAIKAGKFSVFEESMNPLIQQYRATYIDPKPPIWKRALRRLKNLINQSFI